MLDQGLPRSAIQHLRAIGLEAEHVGQLGLATASDEAILAEGRSPAAKKRSWLVWIASALLFCAPAFASNAPALHLKTRAELFPENGEFSADLPAANPALTF